MINIDFYAQRLPGAIIACALALSSLAACTPPERISYTLHNATGRLVVAAIAGSAADERAAFTEDLPSGTEIEMQGVSVTARDVVTVQWLSGPGRARWHEATLPLTFKQAGREHLHLYLRPDQLVCISVAADAALATAPPTAAANCVRSAELAPLAPGMVRAFTQGTVTRNGPIFAEHGSAPTVYTTLQHAAGPVELLGRDEFYLVRVLGNQSGLLVDAWGDNGSDTFVVTGDARRWHARYLGNVREIGEPHTGQRKMLHDDRGARALIDMASAGIFFFPGQPHSDYWILGDSPDGKYVAVAVPQQAFDVEKLRETDFKLQVIDLETGNILPGVIASMPRIDREEGIEKFFGAWTARHCSWSPQLACSRQR